MTDKNVKVSNKIFIRNAGKDEYWLQDIIYENPSILGLGDLVPVNKEKRQSKGGRLDILLKEPSENVMYEVEVMLGETDPSHIIRAIEYWDNEKRKYPQRQHFCVLIAESFDRRYFNVIQLMSLNIPMIAIQVELLEAGNERILNFVKIIDIYVEPEEDEEDQKEINQSFWVTNSEWVDQQAKIFYDFISRKQERVQLRYTQSYISINIDGRNMYWFSKRMRPNSLLKFSVKDDEKVERIKHLFNVNAISYDYNRYKEFVLNIDQESLKKYLDILGQIHDYRVVKIAQDDE